MMGGFSLLSRSQKPVYAKVSTMDADLDRIVLERTWTGRNLFDAVCRIIGLREVWFFGLQYTNKKNIPCWLQMDKTICSQDVPKQSDGSFHFLFLVKFYPEDVEPELILDLTRHLFFLQIKQAILSMDLYCSPEASVLLASFAVQAMHGDCTEDVGPIDLDKLLPKSVIDQYDMSADMWRDRIKRWWMHNAGQSKEEAAMEYLRVAQDLEMYGILYYPICNKKETDLHLGISAQGLGIYKGGNRITPRPFFSWSEIKNIQFKNRKLQQMKSQAKEDRQRRQQEMTKLLHEREERLQAEKECSDLKAKLERMVMDLAKAQDTIRKVEETNEQLSEKARHSEQEALHLYKKASEAEAECHRLSLSHVKSEEALLLMERKAREAEIYAQRISMSLADVSLDTNRKPHYSSQSALVIDPMWAGLPPSSNAMSNAGSHHQLVNICVPGDGGQGFGGMGGSPMMTPTSMGGGAGMTPLMRPMPSRTPPHIQQQHQTTSNYNLCQPAGAFYGHNGVQLPLPPPDPSVSQLYELQNIRGELEKSRSEYAERARLFKEHLEELRRDIDGLKRDNGGGNTREHDVIHAQNVAQGFDKFTTMRMSMRGAPKQRVEAFDGM